MELDKDIVNINENYINYIKSNPKLVQTVDELAVSDTGMTGNYLTLNLTCDNKQLAISPLPIRMPNGEIITSTHTALLTKKDLPIATRKSHLFTGLNKAFLSIGIFCDHGFQATFDENTVLILNKGSGKVMMKGKIDPRSNLYMLNLTHQNKLMTEFTTPDKYFAGSVYECKSKRKLVYYQHASCWSPTQSEWVKAITKNFFISWTGLSSDLVQKYLIKKNQLYLGTFNNLGKAYNQHRKSYSNQNQSQKIIQNNTNFPHPRSQNIPILSSSRQWI